MEDIYIGRRVENDSGLDRLRTALALEHTGNPFHVTLIYSRAAVEWRDPAFAPQDHRLVVPGKGLAVDRFGDAVVLKLVSRDLAARFGELRRAGASWDFPVYQPHVTLGTAGGPLDLPERIDLADDLVLGPEYRHTLSGAAAPAYLALDGRETACSL